MAGGRQFVPVATSPNITPNQYGKPAGLSFEEFAHLMRSGRDPHDATKILQVMPWTVYGKMTTHDLLAVYTYLSAIPPRPNNPNPGP